MPAAEIAAGARPADAGARGRGPSESPSHRPVVVAFVHNPATRDSRVLREAETLATAGYAVTLVATWREGLPREERRGGVRICRIPIVQAAGARLPRGITVVVAVLGGILRRALRVTAALRARLAGAARAVAGRRLRALGRRLARAARALRRALEAGPGTVLGTVRWPLTQWAWYRGAREVVPPAAVYHGHDLTALPVAARFHRALGGRLVYDSHELYLESGRMATMGAARRRLWTWYERRLIRRADAVITVNDAIATELVRRYRLPSPPLVVMNCPPRWHPEHLDPPRPDRFRERLPIGPDRRILLYQGVFAPHRGLEQLAAALLEPGLESAVAVYLGYGALRGDLEALAARAPYKERLFVVDAVPPDELLEWTASADLSLIPLQRSTLNHWLSTPNKLFESLAAGVPVVASRFPEIERIVEAWRVGALVDTADTAHIAAAAAGLLALPADEAAALRRRCRQAALERYNWETEATGLLALYARLAPGPPAPASGA